MLCCVALRCGLTVLIGFGCCWQLGARALTHSCCAVVRCAVLLQSELASLQTTLAREQGAAQNATGRLAVLEASLAEQQVGVSLPPHQCAPCVPSLPQHQLLWRDVDSS